MAREVTIKFLGDESDLTKSTRKASDDLDKFGKHAGRTAGVVAGVTTAALHAAASAARGVTSFLKGAIGEAEESAQMGRVTAQLIKTTGGAAKVSAKHIATYSQSLSNITGIDDEVIQGAQNVLLTFRQVRNETGKGNDIFDRATAAAADLSAVLGTDLKASTLQLGKALADPIKGVGKLQKAGVNFSAQQIDQIKVLVKSGKVLEAQKLILGEVEHQVKGAAAANATATQKMATAWANFKESIGTLILPAFTAVVDWLIKVVLPALQSFADQASKALAPWFDTLGELARVAIDKTMQSLDKLGQWARENAAPIQVAAAALGAFAAALAVMGTANKAAGAVQSLGSTLGSVIMFAGPWGLLAAAIVAVGVGAFLAYQKFKPFRDIVDATGRAISDFVTTVVGAVDWQRFADDAVSAWQTISGAVMSAVGAISAVVGTVVAFAISAWQRYGDEITGILTALGELFAAIWARIVQVVSLAIAVLTPVFDVLKTVWGAAFGVIRTMFKVFVDFVGLLWALFGDEIIATMRNAWHVLAGVVEGGLRIIQGIINVITALISGDWGKAWEGVKRIASGAWEAIRAVFTGALTFLKTEWSAITSLITAPFGKAKQALHDLVSGLAGVVRGIFDGIIDAFKASMNALIDIINTAIRAYNKIPFVPDIDTINPVAAGGGGGAAPAPMFAAMRTAPIGFGTPAAPVAVASRTFVINLPEGVTGHSVVDAVRRYEARNGSTGAGWRRR